MRKDKSVIEIKRAILIITLMLAIYFLDKLPFMYKVESNITVYVIKPLLYGLLILIISKLPKARIKGLKVRYIGEFKWWVFSFSIAYILISVVIGGISGFGKSPYDHSFFGIVKNVTYLFTMLIAFELARNYIVKTFRQENTALFILVATFTTCLHFSLIQYINLKDQIGFLNFLVSSFLPQFCIEFIATYLVFIDGPKLAIIYKLPILIFEWFSPVLPNPSWALRAVYSIMIPAFTLMFIQAKFLKARKDVKVQHEKEDIVGWIFTSLTSISIIWFAVGVFPIYPNAILTGSMQPKIKPGDVILVKKIDLEETKKLKKGEVIQFVSNDMRISHRITEIIKKDNSMFFRTKGDNNPVEDIELVMAENIKGKVIMTVPNIGMLAVMIRSVN